MAKILVTGGAGFIGSHVVKELLKRGDEVVVIDDFNDYYNPQLKEDRISKFLAGYQFPLYRVDIRDQEKINTIFQQEKIDKVCHLAARAGVRASLADPFLYQDVNIRGTMNLLDSARKFGISNFVYASSSSVYGGNKKIPFSEEDSVDRPISPYAATKKACELLAHTYHNLYQLPVTGLRYFTVYGPWGRPDMALFEFTRRIGNKIAIDVYNFGKMRRDFTYIDDIVAGTIAALDKNYPCEVFNLGNNNPEELLYFIERIELELGHRAEKNFLPLQAGDVPETFADIEKAKRLLGFAPRTRIDEGVRKFVNWYQEYYNIITLHPSIGSARETVSPSTNGNNNHSSYELSIVVPVYNEEKNVAKLYQEIFDVCGRLGFSFEIIFVNDGSSDNTLAELKKLSPIKIINFRCNSGQTAALDAGFRIARGKLVITMDGDLQNDPLDISRLIQKVNSGYDVVSGWRKNRHDTFLKCLISRGANVLRQFLINDGIQDSGCTLKIYRRECLNNIELYGEMHRFIPALLKIQGFKIGEIEVNHRPRTNGTTKYNWRRMVKGFLDMLSVWFWQKYSARPLHLFGGLGLLVSIIGGLLLLGLLLWRIIYNFPLSGRVWPLVGFFMILIGVQIFMTGLLVDIVLKNYYRAHKTRPYYIKEVIEN